jgi:hypothetical protein
MKWEQRSAKTGNSHAKCSRLIGSTIDEYLPAFERGDFQYNPTIMGFFSFLTPS